MSTILSISIILQIATAVLALKLIGITKTSKGWYLITFSLILIAFRSGSILLDIYVSDFGILYNGVVLELLAFAISISMFLGVYYLSDVFLDKRRTSAKLKEVMEVNENILENVWTGVWAVDKNEYFNFWNSSMEHITGLEKEDVIGISLMYDIPEQTLGGQSRISGFVHKC